MRSWFLSFCLGVATSASAASCGSEMPTQAVPDGGDPGGPPLGPPLTPGDPGAADVRLTVRSDTAVRAISPLIYGVNGTPSLAQNRPTVVRSGGNRMTAYNWENNASNAGNDYQYQNDAYLTASNTPGEAVRPLVESAHTSGAAALLTVPIVDYVAADKNGGGDIRNTANYQMTRLKANQATKGAPFTTTPDPADRNVYQDEFVAWAQGRFTGGALLYSLDNEPDLWSSTHPEVHAAAVGYDELVQRSVTFARAIKSVAPTSPVLGFVSYGYSGYTTLQSAPDRAGKGEFIDYFLGKMKAAEASEGKRLVDYLDLHWYPEARGGGARITDSGTGAAEADARVQAPRSLWDDTYTEDSWIARDAVGGPIKLLPWLQAKIGRGYPGTGLAFTEWNYGGGGHISGAVATADVLGIFGRDGVALACLWPLNSDERFTYAGLQVYRNFDGSGGAFGDVSISATSSDRAAASVYASIDRATPGRVVLVAINKRTQATRAGITVAHPSAFGRAEVYVLAGSSPQISKAADLTAVAQNAFSYSMPPLSVSILVPRP
jgi:hypothetical protein